SDRLFFARIHVHFRGPLVERVELPSTPSASMGWSAGTILANLADGDPSTCATPSSATATLGFPAPSDTQGTFALEVSAAVDPSNNNPQTTLKLGPSAASGPSFLMGPNDGSPGARERFLTTDLSQLSAVTYEANGSPKVQLCSLERTLLRFRDQVQLVLENGARETFTWDGSQWDPAPGVRDKLVGSVATGFTATRPDGRTLLFAEPRPGGEWRLSELSDAQGRSLLFAYDAGTGRLASVTEEGASGAGRSLNFQYAPSGHLSFISDGTGRFWAYTVDASGDLVEFRDVIALNGGTPGVRYAYDGGHVENPDLDHNLLRVVHPEDRTGDGEGDRWIEFTYYNNDKVASHTDSLGNTQTFLFNVPRLENQTTDPRGFTTVYRHDEDGNLVQRRDPDGAVWDWEYDDERNVVSELDPFARERTFSGFDARGNPAQILDRDGRSTQLTYDPVSGAPAQVTDKRGNKRTVAYSADGLPVSTRATIGGQAAPGTLLSTSEYAPGSRRLTRVTELLLDDGTGRSRDTRLFYEAPGDLTDRDLSRVESRNEAGAVTSTIEYVYDVLGRRTRETVWRK
ncbi:MAG: hypothetical protein L0206_18500, partial [Actinobacteria bacterium]|nr:hypothetical protein [Actinomycetota bacterium]